MNTDTVEQAKMVHDKETLLPEWKSLEINSDGSLTEVPDLIEPKIVKISIPANIQKQILDRYTEFLRSPCKVKS